MYNAVFVRRRRNNREACSMKTGSSFKAYRHEELRFQRLPRDRPASQFNLREWNSSLLPFGHNAFHGWLFELYP